MLVSKRRVFTIKEDFIMAENEKKLIQAQHRLKEAQARDRVKERKACSAHHHADRGIGGAAQRKKDIAEYAALPGEYEARGDAKGHRRL